MFSTPCRKFGLIAPGGARLGGAAMTFRPIAPERRRCGLHCSVRWQARPG
jgi:hypothetical protein